MNTHIASRGSLLSRSQAEDILRPHHEKIARIMDRAWECWNEHARTLPAAHASLSPHARAIYVRDQCLRFAAEEFAGEIEIMDDQQAILFRVSDKLYLRFRKLDKNGKTRNRHTNHSLTLNNAQLDFFIPEAPRPAGITVVVAGYMLDEDTKTKMIDKRIVCMHADALAWSYSIAEIRVISVQEIGSPPAQKSLSRVVPIGSKKVHSDRGEQ